MQKPMAFRLYLVALALSLYVLQSASMGFTAPLAPVKPLQLHQAAAPALSSMPGSMKFSQGMPGTIVLGCAILSGLSHRASSKVGACRSARRVKYAMSRASSNNDVGVILLSGGVGKRMGAKIPKQYLKLLNLEIVLHSLDTFLECNVAEIAIVCAEEWQSIFKDHLARKDKVKPVIKFTGGGKERQDSVQNGLAELTVEYAAVHDGARPLVTKEEVEKVFEDARKYGAALLAVQTKATIKQASSGPDGEPMVADTPNRKTMWEAHTPQVIRSDLLRKGFQSAIEKSLEVTDDVSLVEHLGEPVKLTEGEYTNLKVTTPEDMSVAETILKERGFIPPA